MFILFWGWPSADITDQVQNIQIEDRSDRPSAQATPLSAAAKYPFPEEEHVAAIVKVGLVRFLSWRPSLGSAAR